MDFYIPLSVLLLSVQTIPRPWWELKLLSQTKVFTHMIEKHLSVNQSHVERSRCWKLQSSGRHGYSCTHAALCKESDLGRDIFKLLTSRTCS